MIVGELSLFDGAARSSSASAIHESKLSFVSRAAFDAIASARPEIYRYITAALTRRLRDLDEALKATSFLPIKGRAATVLLSLSDAFGNDIGSGRILIRQKVSQSDLAAMAGIARANFSRILQDWKRRSLVSRLAGYYCLEDKAALDANGRASGFPGSLQGRRPPTAAAIRRLRHSSAAPNSRINTRRDGARRPTLRLGQEDRAPIRSRLSGRPSALRRGIIERLMLGRVIALSIEPFYNPSGRSSIGSRAAPITAIVTADVVGYAHAVHEQIYYSSLMPRTYLCARLLETLD
jgi:hypothetical protein